MEKPEPMLDKSGKPVTDRYGFKVSYPGLNGKGKIKRERLADWVAVNDLPTGSGLKGAIITKFVTFKRLMELHPNFGPTFLQDMGKGKVVYATDRVKALYKALRDG